jgi:hypothetical protein
MHFTKDRAAKVSFSFQGSSFIIYRVTYQNRGLLEVVVDGNLLYKNSYGEQPVWRAPMVVSGFAPGVHTVELRNTSNFYMDVDAIAIFAGEPQIALPTVIYGDSTNPDPLINPLAGETATSTATNTSTATSTPTATPSIFAGTFQDLIYEGTFSTNITSLYTAFVNPSPNIQNVILNPQGGGPKAPVYSPDKSRIGYIDENGYLKFLSTGSRQITSPLFGTSDYPRPAGPIAFDPTGLDRFVYVDNTGGETAALILFDNRPSAQTRVTTLRTDALATSAPIWYGTTSIAYVDGNNQILELDSTCTTGPNCSVTRLATDSTSASDPAVVIQNNVKFVAYIDTVSGSSQLKVYDPGIPGSVVVKDGGTTTTLHSPQWVNNNAGLVYIQDSGIASKDVRLALVTLTTPAPGIQGVALVSDQSMFVADGVRTLSFNNIVLAPTTPTATPTASDTPTATGTATDTGTPTDTATPTATGSATVTPSATDTASATSTASATGTATDTPSATTTGTITSTASATATASATPTATPTGTATRTATPTASPTRTSTPTATASATTTATSTATATNTLVPKPTYTIAISNLAPTANTTITIVLTINNPANGATLNNVQVNLSIPGGGAVSASTPVAGASIAPGATASYNFLYTVSGNEANCSLQPIGAVSYTGASPQGDAVTYTGAPVALQILRAPTVNTAAFNPSTAGTSVSIGAQVVTLTTVTNTGCLPATYVVTTPYGPDVVSWGSQTGGSTTSGAIAPGSNAQFYSTHTVASTDGTSVSLFYRVSGTSTAVGGGQLQAATTGGTLAYPVGNAVTSTPGGGLTITKKASITTASAGLSFAYTVTVNNPTAFSFSGVSITDNVPSTMSVTSVTASLGAASNSGNNVVASVGTLAPNQSVTLTINVTVAASVTSPTTLTNSASVTYTGASAPLTASLDIPIGTGAAVLPTTGYAESTGADHQALLLIVIGSLVVAGFSLGYLTLTRGKR